jgi:hypothetical protein
MKKGPCGPDVPAKDFGLRQKHHTASVAGATDGGHQRLRERRRLRSRLSPDGAEDDD